MVNINQDTNLSFENKRVALLHLKKNGFRISIAKFYRDCKKGMIRVSRDGTVLETEVRAYAAGLDKIYGNIDDLGDMTALKTKKELEKLEEQIAKLRFDRLKEEGNYIERSTFEAELAARAMVFDSGFRYMFNLNTRELIAKVSGKIEKSGELLQALNEMLDQQLSSYSSIDTYQVMFSKETE